jgi:hypothetical protein
MLRCTSFRALAACIFVFSLPVAAWAWGPEGHRIVGRVAQERLSTNARLEVRKLLGRESLADVANWADEYRVLHRETVPWHFVNIRVQGDGSHDAFKAKTDCEDGNCVIEKIKEFEAMLRDKEAGRDERITALKFLVHFVGDIHQPLHCAQRQYRSLDNDRGGNEVHVRFLDLKQPLKLHQVWDSTIIVDELLGKNKPEQYAQAMADKLKVMEGAIAEWRKLEKPEEWAMESHALAVAHSYKGIPVDQPEGVNPKLDQEYVDQAKLVVETQLEKAGVRLADIINRLFPG